MNNSKVKIESRQRRRKQIRKKISGTTERPRLAVFRSLNHIYAQLIDDSTGKTIIMVSDLSKELKTGMKKGTSKIDKSKLVGKLIAEKAIENKIETVVFDRGGYRYHGRVKSLADSAREAGLKF